MADKTVALGGILSNPLYFTTASCGNFSLDIGVVHSGGITKIIMKTRYFLIALAAFAVPAFAINMNVFRDAPMTRLTADEVKVFTGVIINALDKGVEGATVEWTAPKTQFTSKITPGKSTTEGKRQCREVVIESEARDRFQRGTYSFCKAAGGQWQFATPGSKPAKK